MMKRFSTLLLMAALITGFAACGDDDNDDQTPPEDNRTATEKIEDLSMNTEWINYAAATASELLDDCIMLWAAWNGKDGVPAEDLARIGGDAFFTTARIGGADGYARFLKTAGESGNTVFQSQEDAIETILIDGFVNISTEVGAAKIGEPNGFAKAGQMENAVYAVESWYSWNSITDYSDNIVSIKNGYCGRRGTNISGAISPNSISARIKYINPELDAEVNAAIDNAYNSIQSMTAPFRNNLTGTRVDAAMDACADLAEIIDGRLLNIAKNSSLDYTEVLRVYADTVVIPTYRDLRDKAWVLYNAVEALRQSPGDQSKLNAACNAWRATRIPWEQSEAVLFGPASEDILGLDPSMDSWPLSQEEIATILQDSNLKTVDDFIDAIGGEDVRGFHTLELLLFKDGQNRTVR
ncbi:MAG: peptidase M75 [Prevotellaceae bacterium]|jgi:predicted lipoprotein|nr:peptidase M75 [Prevotellaceae bacterium]